MNQGWSFEGGIFDTYLVFLVLFFLPDKFFQIRSSVRFIRIEVINYAMKFKGENELIGRLSTPISFLFSDKIV